MCYLMSLNSYFCGLVLQDHKSAASETVFATRFFYPDTFSRGLLRQLFQISFKVIFCKKLFVLFICGHMVLSLFICVVSIVGSCYSPVAGNKVPKGSCIEKKNKFADSANVKYYFVFW